MCGGGKCIYYGCFECMAYMDEIVYDDDGCMFCSEECRLIYVLRVEDDPEHMR
jgi:hypothetical protein